MSSNAVAAALAKPAANEPSMEEILASIRRIIADDTLGTKPDEPPAQPEPVAEEEVAEATPVDIKLDEDDPDADVLDLAEIASIAAEPVEVEPVAVGAPVISMPELPEPEAVPVMIAAPAPAPAPAPVIAPPPVNSVSALEGHILSQETGSLIGQAFQSLQRNVAVPQGRSLEDIVTEMLRPMLRGWLDEHLPGIVERLVKAEIERVARGG